MGRGKGVGEGDGRGRSRGRCEEVPGLDREIEGERGARNSGVYFSSTWGWLPCEAVEVCLFLWQESGKKKEPKPKLFGPDIFGWGGGLPREGVGAKKFSMSFGNQGNQTFWRDIPGFCWDIPGVPEKFERKMFGFNFRSLKR